MKCKFCYKDVTVGEDKIVPRHFIITNNASQMSAAALECGADEEQIDCPGSGLLVNGDVAQWQEAADSKSVQCRFESDHRYLWKWSEWTRKLP